MKNKPVFSPCRVVYPARGCGIEAGTGIGLKSGPDCTLTIKLHCVGGTYENQDVSEKIIDGHIEHDSVSDKKRRKGGDTYSY